MCMVGQMTAVISTNEQMDVRNIPLSASKLSAELVIDKQQSFPTQSLPELKHLDLVK